MLEKLGGSYSIIFQVTLAIATLIIPWAFTRTRSLLAFLDIKWSLLWLEGELSRLERFHTQSGSLVQFLLTQVILAGMAAALGWIFSSLGNVQGGVRLSVLLNLMFGFMAYGILVHAASMSFRFNQGEDYLNKLRSRIAALRDRLTEPKQA